VGSWVALCRGAACCALLGFAGNAILLNGVFASARQLLQPRSVLFFLHPHPYACAQCTASNAPHSASSASFVVARISSSSPWACSSSQPRHAARCNLSASSCTVKYASPFAESTP